MRIISVVPSITELLYDLNLDDQIIGVTRFCIHPKTKLKLVPKIGGTKSLKIDRIIALKPDLIIANKEENSQSEIEQLQIHCNVLLTDIYTIDDALFVIEKIGSLTNRSREAEVLIAEIKTEFKSLLTLKVKQKNVAYLIWNDPIMLAGKNTFIDSILLKIGWNNVLLDQQSRYPASTIAELKTLNPESILLSSEPFPFKESHAVFFKSEFPNSEVILVDGEMFSWYGSRMKLAPKYFKQLLLELEE